ncbi:MAG TPA: PQQ-binding-like beta-propeller repeat protein [Acidimicrobiales bacterium]|nr:PQQ-binding-like beta-propeller repeat protein [Acidimicrobiales bacterium]
MDYFATGQVSHTNQGPGWWLASDGLWYAPELHPSAPPPELAMRGLDRGAVERYAGTTLTWPANTETPPAWSPVHVPDGPPTDFSIGAANKHHRSRPRRRLLAIAVVAVVALLVGGVVTFATEGGSGWTDPGLHVVGSPIAAGGMLIVLDVNSARHLELTAVDPADGSLVWRKAISASGITPGVAFGPTAIGGTVLGFAPARNPQDPSVTLQGIDATTGKVLWAEPQSLILSDAPAVCPGGQDFCVAGFASATTTALITVDPATGRILGVIVGPERNMTVATPGSTIEGGLWETGANAPTLTQVSNSGQQEWTKTVASVFGGSQYDPNYGWDFLERGALEVGSVGAATIGKTMPLGEEKTVGISSADGTTVWSVPGAYLCGGGLQFLTADVVCRYTGTAVISGTTTNMSQVTMVLEGVNSQSGAITWSLPVLHAQALSEGTNVAFADSSHVVVQLPSGKRVLLDVDNGQTSPLSSGEVFWCEQNPQYKVSTPEGGSVAGERQSAPVFRACSASGAPVTGMPATSSNTVGVDLDGQFVWPTPHGLRAAPLPS